MKHFFIILSLFLLASQIIAQEVSCQPDPSSASELLAQAQAALDAGDRDGAVDLIGQARNSLQLIEQSCIDFAPETQGDKRTNPVPMGQRQRVKMFDDFDASIEVVDLITNANEMVASANMFNAEPSEGFHYIAIELLIRCEFDAATACDFSPTRFSIVGSSGIVIEYESITGVGGSADFFGGAELSVLVPFLVPDDESDFVIFNTFDDEVFFEVMEQ